MIWTKSYRQKRQSRGTTDTRSFKDINLSRHDSFLPRVSKSSQMAKATGDYAEEDVKTEALYKRVRGILNKLTPQKFDTLVNQVRSLEIDTEDRFRGVVHLVHEKAIDGPRYSVAYALMCKELASMQVSGSEGKAEKEESNVNFRKLIITRCQVQFENMAVHLKDETARAIKLKEIDQTADPEKKKELLLTLEEEERRMRFKFVGNVRFIGELYMQGILTANIMHRCIRHLVHQIDDQSLECLCVLLSTVGKDLESKKQNLDPYFNQMMVIVDGKVPGKVRPRVRFMLQDVVELRMNNWVPRRAYINPKTMDEIQIEAETEWLHADMNKTRRKADRNDNRKWKRGDASTELDGCLGNYGRSDYKSSTARRKLRNARKKISTRSSSKDNSLRDTPESQSTPPSESIKSVSPSGLESVPIEAMPTLTEEQLIERTTNILNEFLADTNINNAEIKIRETFNNSTFANFVREALDYTVERSATARQQVSQLMTHLIARQTLPLSLYLTGLGEILETTEDLVINIPKLWVYLAELIWYPLAEDIISFSELRNIMAPLKHQSLAGKLLGELLTLLIQETNPNWIKERWETSGLQWSDFLQDNESVPDFIKKFKLEFIKGESSSGLSTSERQLSTEKTQELLFALLSKEYSVDDINSWISSNVVQPEFIRVLVTAILKASIELHNDEWQFNEDEFENFQPLIARYVDADELLESHCLLAIQEYMHKLEQPKEAFLAWEKNGEPSARVDISVAMVALMFIFTRLKEADE